MSDYWIRKEPPEYGNIYFNNKNGGGVSACINGCYRGSYATKYKRAVGTSEPGRNVLPNCVGMAAGCFNETFVKNMQLRVYEGFQDGWYYNFNCNGYSFIAKAKEINKEIAKNGHKKPLLGIYEFSLYPDATPTVGSIMVYAKGANHVTFVTDVIADGHVRVIQSGYGGWKGPWDTAGCDYCKRSNGWRDGDSTNTNRCIGFITNPALNPVEGDPYWENEGYTATNVVPPPPKQVPITGFDVNNTNIVLTKGVNSSLGINFSPASGTQTALTITSSDTNVVTATQKASTVEFTPVGDAGDTATVTLYSSYLKKTITCNVTIVNPVNDVLSTFEITNAPTNMNPGQLFDIDAIGKDSAGNETNKSKYSIQWSVNNTKRASIDPATGIITALRGGTVSVIATATGVGSTGDTVVLTKTATIEVSPRQGLYADGNFCVPYVFKQGSGWKPVVPKIRYNNTWNTPIEDITKNI